MRASIVKHGGWMGWACLGRGGLMALLALALVGCNAQSGGVAVTPAARPSQHLLTCRRVVLDRVFVNGACPPQAAWDRVVPRMRKTLPGELVINEARSAVAGDNVQLPEVGPHQITLVFLPNSRHVRRGLFLRYSSGQQVIYLNKARIERLAGPLLRERAWELVMMHELGHAMGVPQDAGHDDGTGHCTNCRCVMYRRPDARSVTAAIFCGLPLDFCPRCQAELVCAAQQPPQTQPAEPR